MRALSLVIVVAVTGSSPAHAQRVDPNRAVAAEFPACESTLLNTYQRGARLAAAGRALSREPDSIDTLALLLASDRLDDAIAVTRRLMTAPPDRLLPVLRLVAQHQSRLTDVARGYPEALRTIAQAARARLTELPREDAARAAWQILMFEPPQPGAPRIPYEQTVTRFVQDFAGTDEAQLAQVEQMTRGRPSYEQVDALEAFAREHRGTAAGAKALYSAAHQLSVNIPINGVERRGSDPTDRFIRVLDMARELENGDYPRGAWVDRAAELVAGLFASNPAISPANVARLEAEYVAFAKTHLNADDPDPAESPVGYLLTSKLADLHKTQGDPVPAVERVLDRLAEETGRADVRFMKAGFYLRTAVNDAGRRQAMRQKAGETLRALSSSGTGLYHRKALATLACLEFEDRDYPHALEHFSRYEQQYHNSPYAWLASLRVGATFAAMSDWRRAAESFRAAAVRYDVPLARMLGREYAARSLEAAGEFRAALGEHEAAVQAWDPDYAGYPGRDVTLGPGLPVFAASSVSFEPPAPINRDALTSRVAQLRTSLTHPSGLLLERGRWLLQQERRVDAAETLARLRRDFPRSPFATEARSLEHHARLEAALIIADVEGAAADPAAALLQLTQLTREPYDEAVCIAGIARATLLSRDRTDEARTAMQTALSGCRSGGVRMNRGAASALDDEVLAVRNTVFKPLGGGIFATHGWDSYRWPSPPPPFFLVSAALRVKTHGGPQTLMTVRDPVPGLDNIVFMSSDQLHMLNTVIRSLGGSKRFAPASIMATPNQPAGPALDVLAFWKQFFPAMPGHWGGWELEAFPRIDRIEFLDAARTRAAVPVTIGYSGATILLEKRGGVWHMVELTNRWIT